MEEIIEIYKPQEDTLKPCPFCGSKEIVLMKYQHIAGLRWKVVCTDCMANIDPGRAQDKWHLKDVWNRRAIE